VIQFFDHEDANGNFRVSVSCDRYVAGLLSNSEPRVDGLLAGDGYSAQILGAWFANGCGKDRLMDQARRQGVAVGPGPTKMDGDGVPDVGGQVLMCVIPESGRASWWLRMWRREGVFTAQEQQLALLALKQMQARFNQPGESAMSRLLLNRDRGLLHADPYSTAHFIRYEHELSHIVRSLETIVPQRWPALGLDEEHDFAILAVDRRALLVRFRRCSPLNDAASAHWYVETRLLEKDELPVVGEVEDDRIARSVAYIHDHYREAPDLARMAALSKLSPFHFHRLFTRSVGVSPKQYLQARQLQVARWLLRTTRLSISEIAERTGFASHGHFTNAYQRVTGVSPTVCRETGA